jgi:stress response protein SCP2
MDTCWSVILGEPTDISSNVDINLFYYEKQVRTNGMKAYISYNTLDYLNSTINWLTKMVTLIWGCVSFYLNLVLYSLSCFALLNGNLTDISSNVDINLFYYEKQVRTNGMKAYISYNTLDYLNSTINCQIQNEDGSTEAAFNSQDLLVRVSKLCKHDSEG